ncbi:PqqD family peptide modification chaperone [Fodinicurvata sp. EGI_FJ10296]|uniref:PqqD family peptide modification chaperone n=1 Tax=Fodinicurvata sp. EGI_FJ10296 TaxID=3231908 RepID=UPI0034533D4A
MSRLGKAASSARFTGVYHPVCFDDAADVASVLRALLWGWHFESTLEPSLPPQIAVRREGVGYRVCAPWRREDLAADTPVAAACSLLVDLVRAYADGQPRWRCLHCGAIEVDGCLVLLVGPWRAGKSTLIADLACRGVRVFTDDILLVDLDARVGMSMGIPPRLRLPLPPAIQGRIVAEGDNDHRGPEDGRYLYLRPDTIAQAPFGSTAPLGGLVFLDRRTEGPAEVACMDPDAAFAELIVKTFSGSMLIEELVKQVVALVASSLCIRLTYSASDEAAVTLLNTLESVAAGHSLPSRAPSQAAAGGSAGPEATGPEAVAGRHLSAGTDPTAQYVRIADANEVTLGDTMFVAHPQYGSVHALNATARGMWALLAEPLSPAEATAILQGAFPEVPSNVVAGDVTALFARFVESRLIESA